MQLPFISTDVFEGHFPVNWYFQKQGFNGRPALLGTPGLLLWCDTGNSHEVRGMFKLNSSFAYSVVGNKVFRHTIGATKEECTGVLLSSSGIVQMATNGTYMMIIDGDAGYYVSGTTVTQITDTDFPTPSSLTYQDGYFIVTSADTGRFYISALNDPSSWNALDYTSAEGLPDKAVRAFMLHREMIVFGEESTEPFQNTGASDFPFARINGIFIETGLGAVNAVCKMDNTAFWMAEDFTIRRMSNDTPVIISPEVLNALISGYERKDDIFAYAYKDRGNAFAVFTSPSENKTWVYNAATNAFHQWSSGLYEGRHRSNCHMFFAGKNLVGDYLNGKIYEISGTTYTEDGETIRRKRISPPLFDPDGRKQIVYHSVEIEFKPGVGLATGQGSDPQAMLRYSDDNCKTWSNEKWRSIGKIGKHKDRAIWHMLGSSRIRNYEVSITDPVEPVIVNAYGEITKSLS